MFRVFINRITNHSDRSIFAEKEFIECGHAEFPTREDAKAFANLLDSGGFHTSICRLVRDRKGLAFWIELDQID